MQVTFTNSGVEDTYVSTLYRELLVGESVTARRTYEDLNREQYLKEQIVAGDITITTTAEPGDGAGVGNDAIRRIFAFDDTDIAVAALTAVIDLGGVLPDGAVVTGIHVDNTADWTDGAAGTFAMDVGNVADPNKFTATPIAIDGGVFTENRGVFIPASGDQLRVTITGSVNLDTATAGSTTLTVYYNAASIQVQAAP